MQAWKELRYMNCYWLNSENKNSDKKMTRKLTTKKAKKNGAATCTHNESVFSSKMHMATTGSEQKRQPNKRKVQPCENCCLCNTMRACSELMSLYHSVIVHTMTDHAGSGLSIQLPLILFQTSYCSYGEAVGQMFGTGKDDEMREELREVQEAGEEVVKEVSELKQGRK